MYPIRSDGGFYSDGFLPPKIKEILKITNIKFNLKIDYEYDTVAMNAPLREKVSEQQRRMADELRTEIRAHIIEALSCFALKIQDEED
jgi:hypothetical protein